MAAAGEVTGIRPGAAPSLIGFEGVSKSFAVKGEAVPVLDSIDLGIAEGEIVTLVGPSGCGKSTLLNLAAGLFEPTAGRVQYDGAPVQGLNLRVGYMTQADHLLPWRTVAGNVSAPLEIRGTAKTAATERTRELLELVGLTGFADAYPGQVSGGMKKRAALARLLAYDPQTLLMDEPFGALDAQLRLRLQGELRGLCKRLGKTVLFVTHDLDEAVAVGDRCIAFSARPARIIGDIQVPLGVDRDVLTLRFDPRFVATAAELWKLLSAQLTLETPR